MPLDFDQFTPEIEALAEEQYAIVRRRWPNLPTWEMIKAEGKARYYFVLRRAKWLHERQLSENQP